MLTHHISSSLLTNSKVEHYCTDDLMPNVPISYFPPSCVDPKVQGLINSPQPATSLVIYGSPPISRWSKCGGNVTMKVLIGAVWARCPKTQPEWLDPAQHW